MNPGTAAPCAVFSHRGQTIRLFGYAPDDHIFKAIAERRCFYELDLLEYMRLMLGRGRFSIIDVGANIGNHAVYCGRFIAPLVVAIEPNPPVADILERNLVANAVGFRLVRCGLGARAGTAALQLPPAHSGNVGAARLVRRDDGTGLPVTTLDALAAGLAAEFEAHPPRALKIDVEGMEAEVIDGARQLIGRWRPDLFVEAIDDASLRRLEERLRPLGYRRLISRAGTPVWHFMHRSRLGLAPISRIIGLVLRERTAKTLRRLTRPLFSSDRSRR